MATTSVVGSSQIHKSPWVLPCEYKGSRTLTILYCVLGMLAGARLEVEQLGFQLVLTLDTDVAFGGLSCYTIVLVLIMLFVYLKVRVRKKEERENGSVVAPQMATIIGAGPGPRQEPRSPSGSPSAFPVVFLGS